MEVQSRSAKPWPTTEDNLRYTERAYSHVLKVMRKALFAYQKGECTTRHLSNVLSAIELAKVIISNATPFDTFPKKIYLLGDNPQQKISDLVPKVKDELQKLPKLQEPIINNR